MLIKEEVAEFKKLVFEVYNIVLTDEEAEEQGSRLIRLLEQLNDNSRRAFEAIDLNKEKVQND